MRQLVQIAEGAWNQTAQMCAIIEVCHAAKSAKFDPDKWHPMKETVENLTGPQRRRLMQKQFAKMPKKFAEFDS